MRQQWIGGNHFDLLENGEQFFPRVFEAMAAARRDILVETFILFDDKVGRALHAELLNAARRGVQVDLTIDGWGSPGLGETFLAPLTAAGVRVHVFDPVPGFLRRLNLFRRLHRKIVVVDDEVAFVGGINFSADHLQDFGPEAKQDFSVRTRGPIVGLIHEFARGTVSDKSRSWRRPRNDGPRNETPRNDRSRNEGPRLPPPAGSAEAMFVWRDNRRHTRDIERQYRLAIRLARRRVVIANAYFFPGYAFLRDLRKAARRGVRVILVLQGKPDMPLVQTAASMLYYHLLSGGVQIFEYCERPLHGKVAVADDEWATVGSSNLDPLSLSLNLEANVMIRDRDFNARLAQTLQRLIDESCKKIEIRDLKESGWWRLLRSYLLFHVLRRYPSWLGWLPAHVPRLESVQTRDRGMHDLGEKACR